MEVKCKFRYSVLDIDAYSCEVTEASITEPETEIAAFIGKHLIGKSKKSVKMIYFDKTVVNYFPRGLLKIYHQLTILSIRNCGLKSISREDLFGLENLESLWVDKNELQSLPSDLFVGMMKLVNISFCDNKIEFMSSKLLKPIAGNQIDCVDLSNNLHIDAIYCPGFEESVASLQELMNIIDEECCAPKEEKAIEFKINFADGMKELWTSKKYSDFTIIGGGGDNGDEKEFAVHKNVHGTQNAVPAAVFEADMKEKQTGKMKIEDFSAEVVEGMLHFMYTGDVHDKRIAMDLFAIAAKYEVAELKSATEKIILRIIDNSNALEIFRFGQWYNSEKMKRAALEVISQVEAARKIQQAQASCMEH